MAITTTDLPSRYPLVGGVLNLTSDRETGILVLLRLGDLRRVQEREEQEEREREEVGGPEPGEYDYDPDQGYARAVESDERWAECVEALFSAGAGGRGRLRREGAPGAVDCVLLLSERGSDS